MRWRKKKGELVDKLETGKRQRERESVCVCVCEREREREREKSNDKLIGWFFQILNARQLFVCLFFVCLFVCVLLQDLIVRTCVVYNSLCCVFLDLFKK